MSLTIDLPNDLEQLLREEQEDLGRFAREAVLIELFRRGRIGVNRLAELLGLGRAEALDWLIEHNVSPDYTLEDFVEDRRALDAYFGRVRDNCDS